nr:MOSC domain-containing protein [Bacillus sp. X1(2014)]
MQVSQPRNPCYKLAAKYELPKKVFRMRGTGYTGFLLRVLKEGMVTPSDDLVLLEEHPQQVSVSLVNDVKFFDRFNKEKLEKVLSVDALSESLRAILLKQFLS